MAIRSATIDEFPEISFPNQAQTERRTPSGPRPPLRQPALTSRSFIRNDLRRRTGARVAPAAVDHVQALLDGLYDDILNVSIAKYRSEADLRASHGINEHCLTFQVRHVVPPTFPFPKQDPHRFPGGDGAA